MLRTFAQMQRAWPAKERAPLTQDEVSRFLAPEGIAEPTAKVRSIIEWEYLFMLQVLHEVSEPSLAVQDERMVEIAGDIVEVQAPCDEELSQGIIAVVVVQGRQRIRLLFHARRTRVERFYLGCASSGVIADVADLRPRSQVRVIATISCLQKFGDLDQSYWADYIAITRTPECD
jgi:hypothetical protein